MSLVNVFYSRINSCRYVFPDGAEAAFIGGRYSTDDENKIACLNSEIKQGHPHIFIDPTMVQVDSKDLDPAEVLKKRILEEAIAAGLVMLPPSTSEQQPLKPASSADLVDVKSAEQVALDSLPATPAPTIDTKSLLASIKK